MKCAIRGRSTSLYFWKSTSPSTIATSHQLELLGALPHYDGERSHKSTGSRLYGKRHRWEQLRAVAGLTRVKHRANPWDLHVSLGGVFFRQRSYPNVYVG